MTGGQNINIKLLSALARIELDEGEIKELESEIQGILSFVASIKEVAADIHSEPKVPAHRNVMRADTDPHESGIYTENMLRAAPRREKNHIKVSQVLKGGKYS